MIEGSYDIVLCNLVFDDSSLMVCKFVEDKCVLCVLFEYLEYYGMFEIFVDLLFYWLIVFCDFEVWFFVLLDGCLVKFDFKNVVGWFFLNDGVI